MSQQPHQNHQHGPSSLAMHNVAVAGRRTSVRLEPLMWNSLRDVALQKRVAVDDLVTEIDRCGLASSLTAAIRVYLVDFYRAEALRASQAQAVDAFPPLISPIGWSK